MVKQIGDDYIVKQTEPGSWSSTHLIEGHIVHTINKQPPQDYEMVQKFNLMEQAETITIKDPLTDEHVRYKVQAGVDTHVIFQTLIPALVFIFSIYSSNIILTNRTESTRKSSLLLVLFLFDISLAYIMAGASARGNDLARLLIPFFFMLVPLLYLHFVYSYFKEFGALWFSKHWITFGYGVLILASILNISIYVPFIPSLINPSFVTLIFLGGFVTLFVIVVVGIMIGLRKLASKTHRYLLRGIAFMNVVAFLPFVLLYAMPYVFFDIHIFSPVILSSFIMLIPLSLGYQFMMRKIYDIDFIVGRMKYYILLSIVPALLGTSLLILLNEELTDIFAIQGFIIMSLIIYVAFYLKEFMDYKFKFIRISEKQNYQQNTFEFMEQIREANDLSEVIEEIKNNLKKMLMMSNVSLIEYFEEQNVDFSDISIEDVKRVSEKVGTIVPLENGFLLNIGDTKDTHFIIKAFGDGNLPRLTRDETTWLKSLAYYTHVTIENFSKIENVMLQIASIDKDQRSSGLVHKVLYQLEEKQRGVLARDLHDSVLQDLLSIKKKVELNTYGLDTDSEQAKELMLKDMSSVIKTTRNTCHELRPNTLFDLGIEKATKKLVDTFAEEHGLKIRFTANRIDGTIPNDIQLNLYRVIQELLNNSSKHAKATTIAVILVKIGNTLTLHYEDDGVGVDPSKLYTNKASIGLSGMRERVRMLGGNIEITTAEGEGFKALVEIELK